MCTICSFTFTCTLSASSFLLFLCQKAPKKAKKRTAEGANSNVFSMFEQAQIQEFKEVKAAQLIFILLILHLAELDSGNGVWICTTFKSFPSWKHTATHTQRFLFLLPSTSSPLLCLSISIVHRRSMSTCLFSCPRLGSSEARGMLVWEWMVPRHPDCVISD